MMVSGGAGTTATIDRIRRYPMKGLSGEDLTESALEPGRGVTEDRRFAIARTLPGSGPPARDWQPKDKFATLMRHPRLARLVAEYRSSDSNLLIRRDGKTVAEGDPSTARGRQVIEQFLGAFLATDRPGSYRLVEADANSFTDTRENIVSLINLASVADIERVVRAPVDPLRFRGNIYLRSTAPWREMNWPGRILVIGDARLRVLEPIERCAATNVDPASGVVDRNIPKSFMQGIGHVSCGVYAEVVTGGKVAVGDPYELA